MLQFKSPQMKTSLLRGSVLSKSEPLDGGL